MAKKDIRDCLWAVIEVQEDGTIICPLIDNEGCEFCMEAWENHLKWLEKREEHQDDK